MNQAALFHNGKELDCEGYNRKYAHFELTFKEGNVTLTNTNEFSFGMMQFEGDNLVLNILDEDDNRILFFKIPYYIRKWDVLTYTTGSINLLLPDQTNDKFLNELLSKNRSE